MTILSYVNTGTEAIVCQGRVLIGNGIDDLDGTGGEFELTLNTGTYTLQPNTQFVFFEVGPTSGSVMTESFYLGVGDTVTFSMKSPNAADTSVWVRACIYEVAVQTLRDDLTSILADVSTLAASVASLTTTVDGVDSQLKSVRNIYVSKGLPGIGVYPIKTESPGGVYPWR